MAVFDCTGIVNGSCGNSYNDANRIYTTTVSPSSTTASPWSYAGEVANYFNYSHSFTVPTTRLAGAAWDVAGTPVVIRFYQVSTVDSDAGKASISLLIPGGLSNTYYDTTGRRIQKVIRP